MLQDEYGEIINGTETYDEIRKRLFKGENVIIGWTDEECTHFDILFSLRAYKPQNNYLQRGLRGNELFVSIIGLSAFGFDIDSSKHSGYIAEKLNIKEQHTIDKFGRLINGILGFEGDD